MVEACSHTGVSMAAVALANGLNANMLRNWVVAARTFSTPASNALPPDPGFVPVAIAPATAQSEICIEILRGDTTVRVRWPMQAASECAACLRTWLR
jgi:transposase